MVLAESTIPLMVLFIALKVSGWGVVKDKSYCIRSPSKIES
jgi:hypothetical protein